MRLLRCILWTCTFLFVLPASAAPQEKKAITTNTEKQNPLPVPYQASRETLTPEQQKYMTLRADIMKAQALRTLRAPELWPQQRRWSPRRHFGPLYGNSPDVHLNGGTAAFVYNAFFTGNPDANVFQKYYGSTLPSNVSTPPSAIPGTFPAGGFGDVRLGFDRLTYSSRYGGSFKLAFRSLEDFQVEYRKANAAWDIAALEAFVYVRPVPSFFNPNQPLWNVPQENVHVEFHPQGVVGYSISTSGNLTLQQGDPLPALMTALDEPALSMVQGSAASQFRTDATRFSHALTHAAFWQEIGQTRNVTGIEISDDFFFPRTRQGLPVAVVQFQAADVRLDTEPGSEEIYITVDAQHMFQGLTSAQSPTFSWEFPQIDDRGSTPWQTVGVFPLDWDCGQLQTVLLMLTVREADPVFDDLFYTDPVAFQTGQLDCSGMQTAFNNGQFGLYRELPEQQLLILKHGSGDVAGALTARLRISVVKQ